jgi:hypothetical protein
MDLAVATTFRPGSAGGGGRGGGVCGNGGGAGAGAGGALRISSRTRILIEATGILRANGGNGSGSGASGSGGVVYLAAPTFENRGNISAVGGTTAFTSCPAGMAGAGGLGRIRLSVLPERCTALGSFNPPLPAGGCVRTSPSIPGRTYVDVFPF